MPSLKAALRRAKRLTARASKLRGRRAFVRRAGAVRLARGWTALAVGLLLGALVWWPSRAYAEPPKDAPQASGPAGADDAASPTASPDAAHPKQCVAAFDDAQKLRLGGKLVEARAKLVRCAQSDCPAVISGKCVPWLEQVTAALPSLVVAVRDHRGQDIVDADLLIDGARVSEHMDGSAMELDAGPHVVEVRHKGRRKRVELLLREGEKRRRLEVVFDPPSPPAPPPKLEEPGFSLPAMSWIGFGMAATGVLVGAVTGVTAVVLGDELQDRCEQGVCHPPEEPTLSAGVALAHSSTASFLVAGAGVALGVVGLFIGDEEPGGASATLRFNGGPQLLPGGARPATNLGWSTGLTMQGQF